MQLRRLSQRSGSSSKKVSLILGLGVAGLLGLASSAFAQTQVNSGFSFTQEDTFDAGSGFTQASPDYTGSAMITVNPNVGGGSDGYLNVVDGNGNWVVQNMPITPNESPTATAESVDLGTADDTQEGSVTAAVYFSTTVQSTAPTGGTAASYSLGSDDIDPQGGGTDPNLSSDETDFAPVVQPGGTSVVVTNTPNWNGAGQGTQKILVKNFATFNVQAALNQCGPAAEANGINYLAANNTVFAGDLGVNNNNNPGQGVFAFMTGAGNPIQYTPVGTYPYTGNATTYYVTNANANSANTVMAATNSSSGTTSSLVAQMDIATARQAGAVAGPVFGIYTETPDRTQGQGVFPLQGLINFMNPIASPSMQINIQYESRNNFENPTVPNNPNLIVAAQNGGNININSSPGWMYSQLNSGAMVTLSYATYSYKTVATWNTTTGNIVTNNAVANSTTYLAAHEVFVTGETVTGAGANAQYQVLLTSDLDQANDTSLGNNPSFWTTLSSKTGTTSMYLNGAGVSGQYLDPATVVNNGNGTKTGTYTIYYTYVQNVETASVPEPASASLLLIGSVGLLRRRARRLA